MPKWIPQFEPGDVLLYSDGGIVDRLICFRTWSDVAHIEIYLRDGKSTASRNGIGVGVYPQRLDGLKYIYQPVEKFQLERAEHYAAKMSGTKYGWLDLLKFYGFKVRNVAGIVCSTYGDLLLRAAGIVAFSTSYDAGMICPRDFKISPAFKLKWSHK